MGKKVLTAEEIKAKKNVDPAQVVARHETRPSADFEVFEEPRGSVYMKGEEYFWSFYSGDTCEVVSGKPHKTCQEAEKHCKRIMGVAWNFPIEVMV
jgi:hypothetical protein